MRRPLFLCLFLFVEAILNMTSHFLEEPRCQPSIPLGQLKRSRAKPKDGHDD